MTTPRPRVAPVLFAATAFVLATVLVPLLALGACGSNNSASAGTHNTDPGKNPPAQPKPRPPLPAYPYVLGLKFPTQDPSPSTMNVVRAFPNLAFSRPLFLTHPGDGTNRIFVVEQGSRTSGRNANIYVFPNNDSVTTAQRSLFLSLSVSRAGNEEGLLGLAFDPDYRKNGYFYVYYSASSPRRSVVSRFSVSKTDPNKADQASEKILLTQSQPYSNHNGGMLAFGPDNMLYISFGDGGSGGDPQDHGQNLGTLLGSICRIDPHGKTGSLNYGIPHDNPFVNKSGARGEIWAWGLRNPWRFSFDRNTGQLWAGDVGQGAREEVDIITKGGNYGWRWFEGNRVYRSGAPANLGDIKPIWDYDRAAGRSITGGYVYRGSKNPSLYGAYLVADYATRNIWALTRSGGNPSTTVIGTVSSPSSFGEDRDGEVYVVSLNGAIYRFTQRTTPKDPPFPIKLSDTGLFVDTKALVPDPTLLPYTIEEPFWSDNAVKQRWIAMPQPSTSAASKITFSPNGTWQFPKGTVLVKHFELETTVGVPSTAVRLETRVLVRETLGWAGYVYRWNNQGTDAFLLPGRDTRELTIQDP
ncbi:MAG: PQQ-dependent sugar dehydrogenase, partial [Planctomycetota bacterium]